ncbi:hypothetical protein SCE1572_52375 [Sorangium cellulosum So0157-2]|uniref:Uncharacterized protein n=1 Tax=Sorangium cellulosum So0157-2 TaxID=1254432 RepID=S4YDC5_SORCE|nr:hypothetical protein SCE1572_52375 [Sorangium cellulosum So0157-2]
MRSAGSMHTQAFPAHVVPGMVWTFDQQSMGDVHSPPVGGRSHARKPATGRAPSSNKEVKT